MGSSGEAGILLTVVVPVLLFALPLLLCAAGVWLMRRRGLQLEAHLCFFFAVHSVTLFCATGVYVYRGSFSAIPPGLLTLIPMLLAAVYLAIGALARSSFFWAVGLTTPGLTLIGQKAWAAMSGLAEPFFRIPQDPIWYLLAAVVIFGLRFTPRHKDFWENMEAAHLVASCGYAMIGLWLLAAGQASFLSALGISQPLWAGILMLAAAGAAWCARQLSDLALLGCSGVGFLTGLVSFFMYYPK